MSYNGWSNWETWNVALWIDNDEPLYRERVRRGRMDAGEVEDFVREVFPDGTPDMGSTVPRGDGSNVARMANQYARAVPDPYAEVDWHEIAEAWNSEHEDEE